MIPLTDGALVLEGGGMRGAFTAGVLDFFLDKNVIFNKVYGVSAGACHACSYLSRQRGRAFKVVADYAGDPRYMGVSNMLKSGDFFSEEFVYHTIPEGLNPYDYKAFGEYEGEFYAVATNCSTGEAEYFLISDMRNDIDKIRASSSIPLLSRLVEIDGNEYLDGASSDSVPVKKAMEDGAKKCVVVLTREKGYTKEQSGIYPLVMLRYPFHNQIGQAMKHRHEVYNAVMDYINEKEAAGEIFVLRPLAERLDVGRLERDEKRLRRLYDHGYITAQENFEAMAQYLGKD